MPSVPIRQLGAIGIVKDVSPFDLPPNAFSDGINVRFDTGKVQRAPVHRVLLDSLTVGSGSAVPVHSQTLYNESGFDTVFYANNDGRLMSVANGAETEVSETSHTANSDPRPYTGCYNARCLYLNRPDNVPMVFLPSSSVFETLPNWDSTWRCAALRAYQGYVIALNVTKGSDSFPTLFKWSDPAPDGGVPVTWDITDATKLAGENPIGDLTTPIVDGGVLGNNFIVYSRSEVELVSNVGGEFIFQFTRLPFSGAGLINQNCFVEVDGKHYVWGPTDIYVHDGVQKDSIIDEKNLDTFYRELNIKKSSVFFVQHDKSRHEIIFCGVSASPNATVQNSAYCNYGAVFNYSSGTWSFVDLPNVSSGTEANADTVWTFGTVPAAITFGNVGGSFYDQQDSFERAPIYTAVKDTTNGISASRINVLDYADRGFLALPIDTEATHPAWVERTGLDLDIEGAPLRGYKQVNSVSPLVQVYKPGVTIQGKIGAHPVAGVPPVYDASQTLDPAVNYFFNTRQGGRFIAFQVAMVDAHDFDLSGFDADVTITGKR